MKFYKFVFSVFMTVVIAGCSSVGSHTDTSMIKLKRNNSGIWVLVAVQEEFAHPNANIIYTGIGKINAAIAAQHVIETEKPRLILSIGTAGSRDFDFGQIVNPTGWVQRDMNLTAEQKENKYIVPLSGGTQILRYGLRDARYAESICGTGDTFVRTVKANIWNCVEMEGYAIAYAAQRAKVPFAAYKFISDGKSDKTTSQEWRITLEQARTALHQVYEDMQNNMPKQPSR
jgi:adenosylhomocysteine nucleosidase